MNPFMRSANKRTAGVISFVLCLLLLVTAALPAFAADTNNEMHLNICRKEITLQTKKSTDYSNNYFASTPGIVTFTDHTGAYNVISFNDPILYIDRYDSQLNLISSLTLAQTTYRVFGNIICDEQGYYYVCMACYPLEMEFPLLTLIKYDYNGKFIAQIEFKGEELAPNSPADYWGTQYPFDAGTCALALNKGIIACNFAREMYSGHQSNMVFYVDSLTMERVNGKGTYCSHSFNQACIATSDGGFLMANQGDAYPRSFVVTKITPDRRYAYDIDTFHFREGTDRAYGYNETYAQLGGIAETDNAYVLCAASERTLSLDVAPTKETYCSYSEARDLFVQILKKEYYRQSTKDAYYAQGETRPATGTRPSAANTELFLSSNTTDYGVIWLTDYDDTCFVASPKLMRIENNRLLIMWEKRLYEDYSICDTFYMILNEDGTVHKEATSIGSVNLPKNADLTYSNGTVYWATASYDRHTEEREYALYMFSTSQQDIHTWDNGTVVTPATCIAKGTKVYTCTRDASHKRTVSIDKDTTKHNNTKNVATILPTVDSIGYTAGVYCEDCKTYVSGHTQLDKLPHPLLTNGEQAKLKGDTVLICTGCTTEQLLSQAESGASIVDNNDNAADIHYPTTGMYLVFTEHIRYAIVMPGDADGDAKITVADARLALRASVGLESYDKNGAIYMACNVDGNELAPSDARSILRVAVSLDDAKQWIKP